MKVPANGFAVFAANLGSGVDAPVLEPEGARAYGADGRIVIVGDYTTAAVYDLSGRAMPSMEVPAGLLSGGNRRKGHKGGCALITPYYYISHGAAAERRCSVAAF